MKPEKTNSVYKEIKSILEKARQSAYRAVNFTMVTAYWEIGRCIVEYDQGGKKRAGYREGVLVELSEKLSRDFGKGFSVVSLKNFRQFYLTFSSNEKGSAARSLLSEKNNSQKSSALRSQLSQEIFVEKSSTLRPELTWTHYRLLMRVENEAARSYYMQETIEQAWSTRALQRQIDSFYYERIVSSKKRKQVKEEAKKNTQSLAVVKENTALFYSSNENDTCLIEFKLIGDSAITIEQKKGICYAGMGVTYDGNYKNSKILPEEKDETLLSLGIFKTEKEDSLFRSLVGDKYDAFDFSTQTISEEEDLDSLNAKVYYSGVTGLYTIQENIIMEDSLNNIWAAVLDEEKIYYFTNCDNTKQNFQKQ